jgi:hypothetical protein
MSIMREDIEQRAQSLDDDSTRYADIREKSLPSYTEAAFSMYQWMPAICRALSMFGEIPAADKALPNTLGAGLSP